METENFKKAREIFKNVIEIKDPAEQEIYLDNACRGDQTLRIEVDALLRSHDEAGDFLVAPGLEQNVTLDGPCSIEGPGTKIGRYKLLELIGEGGMGLVYLAEQEEPVKHRVAIKLVKPGMDTKQVIARFEAERQVLALLDYPNIAHVFDAGMTPSGRPYFVMEYVKGLSITEYCDQHKLNIEKRLRLFQQVCDAVHYAHQKGTIHRDIKPSNILVTVQGDRPVPKIIDFGIAKTLTHSFTAGTLFTQQGQLLGTPEYMSPEQVDMARQDIDTRSDIYSLGVLLYELLSGALPFDRESLEKGGFAGIQRTIREQEPPNPSARLTGLGEEAKRIAEKRETYVDALAKRLHRELEWIPLKAMRKERVRRYRSVSELSDDIQNYLNGAPLIAGPETAVYIVKKFVHKHAGSVATVAIIAVAIILGFVISTAMYMRSEKALEREAIARVRAEKAEKLAQERAEAYRRAMYSNTLAMAKEATDEGNLNRAQKLLSSCEAELRGWEWQHLNHISSDPCIRTFHGHNHSVNSVAISPNGKRIASGGGDRTVKIWDANSGTELMTLTGHERFVWPVVFSPDSAYVASGSADETIKIWDAKTGDVVLTISGHTQAVSAVAFSPDGKRIVSGSNDGTIKIWDAITGDELITSRGHTDEIYSIALSPNGKRIASGSLDKTVRVWDVNSGGELMILKGHNRGVWGVAFSPDGKRIASGSEDNTIKIWDANTGDEEMTIRGHTGTVSALVFSPDGERLASCSRDKTVRVWDAATGTELTTLTGHADEIYSITFSPDGGRIFSSGRDCVIRAWKPVVDRDVLRIKGSKSWLNRVAFSPDSKYIAAATGRGVIKLWDAVSGADIKTFHGHYGFVQSIAFSPDGRQIVSGGNDKTVKVWNVATSALEMTLTGHTDFIWSVAFSPDGKRIVSASKDETVRLWNVRTGITEVILTGHKGIVYAVTFSPDGSRIVSAGYDGTVRVWDASSGAELLTLRGHKFWCVYDVSVSPDGKHIVSCGREKTVRVWDAANGEELMALHGHESPLWTVAFSPDGRRIVSGDYNREVKIWDAGTGTELMTLYGVSSHIRSAVFSPDGKSICVGGDDGNIILWESVEPAAGYESRQTVKRARKHLDKLYEEYGFYFEVINKLKEDQTLNESVRKMALQVADSCLWEDAEKLRSRSQYVTLSPDHDEVTYREALEKAEKAASLDPDYFYSVQGLGQAQYRVGAYEDAMTTLARAAKIKGKSISGDDPLLNSFMAMALHQLGRDKEAKAALQRLRDGFKKLVEDPYLPVFEIFLNLVVEVEKLFAGEDSTLLSILELIEEDKLDAASEVIEKFRSSKNAQFANRVEGAIKLLGTLYSKQARDSWNKSGEYSEMIAYYEKAVRIDPNNARTFNELGWILATCPSSEFRDGNRAVKAATRACELTDYKNQEYSNTLAAAYSEAGDFDEAVKWQKKAIDLIPEDQRTELQAEYEERLDLYKSGKAYCEGARWSFSIGELVAWWRLNEVKDGNAVDSSGHGHHGTFVGDANIVTDPQRGNVLKIEGNGFVDCGNSPAFDITGSITVSSWIKVSKSDKYLCIVTKGASGWGLHRRIRDPESTRFLCPGLHAKDISNTNDIRQAGIVGNPDVYDGRWHHLTGVYDGKRMYLYVDGRLDASKAAWGNIVKSDYPVYIGSNSEFVGPKYKGLIDDVRIYSYALSPDEVMMLYEGKEPPHKKGL